MPNGANSPKITVLDSKNDAAHTAKDATRFFSSSAIRFNRPVLIDDLTFNCE